jgi:diaminohydroxyphosphoribosylaminopyrimidine deaminase / 5-amino-6-(5-phosphoribosylamino)uracil reductase
MDAREAMREALACAYSVEGRTSPRPPVGAVIVRDGKIVGRGASAPPYGPHAEILALAQAGSAAQGADLYTTLEPCCIHVHTPPCTDAICKAGVRRVVIGALDPNPRVYTQGIEQLRRAGLDVSIYDGEEARKAAKMVAPFATYITKSRSHVTAKWAMTLDGKIASAAGDANWISGSEARIWVHDLRDRVDAILVGAGTARMDNPYLTVRLPSQYNSIRTSRDKPPLRIILSTYGQLPASLHLLQPELASGTCIIVGETCTITQREQLRKSGAEIISAPITNSGQIDLDVTLQMLAQRDLMHVLLEGGMGLLGSAFDQCCIDHVAVFIAPKLIGGKSAPSPIGGVGMSIMAQAREIDNMSVTSIGTDILFEGDIAYNKITPEFSQD